MREIGKHGIDIHIGREKIRKALKEHNYSVRTETLGEALKVLRAADDKGVICSEQVELEEPSDSVPDDTEQLYQTGFDLGEQLREQAGTGNGRGPVPDPVSP
jgi:hypothetical protein